MKNANTKLRASSVSKSRGRLLKSWAAVSVLAASLLFIGLLTGCPHNQPSAVDQPPAKPVDPIFKTDGNGKITGYKCAQEALPANLVIPAKIGDEEIKEIDRFAFSDCTGLTSISLPANLTKIGHRAFWHCTGLTSISLPANLTKIDDSAFEGCTSLTSITLPANLTEIGYGAFFGCTGLTSVHLPANLTQIGYGAFFGCTGLTSVHLPANLTKIESGAFEGCTGLTSITLPANLT
ncbi:leucine-rich repeat domain-containing protein, partial [Treponema denticola]|uniref:leucine-rich repeat domain-containing protein n=1 Tax=Treponema denticola TaxID=158 RepID=UPI0002B4E178